MNRVFPLFLAIGFISFLRLSNLSIRLSDTNIYFYTAYEILNGKLLYKDIFFTNFPVFPYMSAFYLLVSNKNILFYYFTSTLEIITITIIIYFILYKKTKDIVTSTISSLLYLFSFMVLSTSEHQTGVFLASLFAVIAYYYWEEKKYFFTGILLSMMLLTKAYFIPIALAFFITLLLKKKYHLFLQLLFSFFITTLFILSPFLLFSRTELFNDIIAYSLSRSPGVSKEGILWFFISKDFVFFVLLIFNLFNYKNQQFFSLVSIFTLGLFIFYSDPYYLYFNFLPPMLSLSFPHFAAFVQNQLSLQKMVLPSILAIFLFYTFSVYYTSYRNLGKFSNVDQMVAIIEKEKPTVLYGVNDTTPALAYLTKTPILHHIVDTNTNIFRKGLLDNSKLTHDAVEQKALVITHGAYYPLNGINEPVIDEIFEKSLLKKHCRQIHSHPVYTEGIINQINLFSCK